MSDDDWDIDVPAKSGTSTPAKASVPAPAPAKAPARGKWADEDAEDDDEDWDKSDSEKQPSATTNTAAAGPVRKKKLKEKLAEKERLAKEGSAADDLMDTRTEQDRHREAREKELLADLAVASDLMGNTALSPETTKEALEQIITGNPNTKADFEGLSKNIMILLDKHTSNPLYPSFVEILAKDLCEGLLAVQVRKVGSGLATLGNTKQQEERDKASGKKKPATASKAKLGGSTKDLKSTDVNAYEDALDDYDDDGFM